MSDKKSNTKAPFTPEKLKEREEVTRNLKEQADAITTRRTLYAAGAGLIPFPLIDIATLLGVQVIMIQDIADVYGFEKEGFKEHRIKSYITTLVGDLATVGVMSGVKAIPVVGGIVGAFSTSVTGAAATYALGKVFTQHFDQGGTLLNFDPIKSQKHFKEVYTEGKDYVESDLTDGDEKRRGGWRRIIGEKKPKNSSKIAELEKLIKEQNVKIEKLTKEVNTK